MIDSTEQAFRQIKAEYARAYYATERGKAVRRAYCERTWPKERERRRERYATDPEYRERVLEKNRRCYRKKARPS